MAEETKPTVMPKIDQRIAQLGIDFVELSEKAGPDHLDRSVAFFQQQAKQSKGAERELYYNLAEYLTNQYYHCW